MKGQGKMWCIFAISDHLNAEDLAEVGGRLERFSDRSIVTATPASKTKFLSRSHEVLDGVKQCAAFRLVADRSRALDWVLQEASRDDTVVIFTNEANQTAHDQRSDLRKLRRAVEQHWQSRKRRGMIQTTKSSPNLKIFG